MLDKRARKLLFSIIRSGKGGIAQEVLVKGDREARTTAGQYLEILLGASYIERFTDGLDRTGFGVAFSYRATPAGKSYYEEYKREHFDIHWTRGVAFTALLISLAALVISIVK